MVITRSRLICNPFDATVTFICNLGAIHPKYGPGHNVEKCLFNFSNYKKDFRKLYYNY